MKKRNLNGVLKLLINIMSNGIVALSNKAPHLMKQKPEDWKNLHQSSSAGYIQIIHPVA